MAVRRRIARWLRDADDKLVLALDASPDWPDDPQIMVDVINVSSGLNTAIRDKFPKSVMPGTFDYGFYTGLMYKDVRLCVEEGEAMGVPMPLAGAVHQMWLMANAVNGPGSDFTEITKIIEKWAGVEVRSKKK